MVAYGGSLSGEHGDGQARGELLPKMFGPELMDAFREFKAIWDPEGRMNPGKVVDAHRWTRTSAWARSPPHEPTDALPLPGDDGGCSRARRCAAWASACAGASRAAPCARATG